MDRQMIIKHASSVALGSSGVLILGRSGSGKSALALQLMALGCLLIADDQTIVTRRERTLFMRCPPSIRGKIEARYIGILAAQTAPKATLQVAVDLDRDADERLPRSRETELLGVRIPLIWGSSIAHLPAALIQYLKGGRIS